MSALIRMIGHTFPSKPGFTAKDLPDLQGKVYIVTGANSGLGKETAQILYSKNAKVYIAARSEAKSRKAIEDIKTAFPESTGHFDFLHLDLADLSTIKSSAQEFLRKESELHVLFNNAGVGYPDAGSRTAQGHALELGVNCIGPFLFTQLLTPTLVATAKASPPNTVRVVWVSSSAAEGTSPTILMENLNDHNKSSYYKYFASKLGNYLHATEYALRHKDDGVVSVSLNPGNLDSDLWREFGAVVTWIMRRTVLYPPIFGAYTNLFAGFSPDVTMEKTGSFLAPWGRFIGVSQGMLNASKSRAEGGTGVAQQFWEWSERQVEPYL